NNFSWLQLELVKLFTICQSRMEEVVPKDFPVRDELDVVESFASSLPMKTWMSCKFEMMNRPFEMMNRPMAPVLIILHKK
uniref:Uncharacterized protein n=1 Tax=Oryza glaberrima TaxID=4538 RepID=I1PX66_ORYGL